MQPGGACHLAGMQMAQGPGMHHKHARMYTILSSHLHGCPQISLAGAADQCFVFGGNSTIRIENGLAKADSAYWIGLR